MSQTWSPARATPSGAANDAPAPSFGRTAGPPPLSRPLIPWEDSALDAWPGFFKTAAGLLTRPVRFFDKHRPGDEAGQALAFGLMVVASVVMIALFAPALGLVVDPGPKSSGFALKFGLAVAGIVFAPLAAIVLLLVESLWVHLWLIFFGAAEGRLKATIQAVSYSTAPYPLVFIPAVGPAIAAVWGVVIQIVALRRLHGAGLGRVAAALLAPFLALAAALVVLASILS